MTRTIALTTSFLPALVFLFIEHLALFRNADTVLFTVLPDQDLHHVGDATMLLVGGNTYGLLDGGIDPQVHGGGLFGWHD